MTAISTPSHSLELPAGGRVVLSEAPVKDRQTVRADGERLAVTLDGVEVRHATTQLQSHGSLCEIFSEDWGFTDFGVPFVYEVELRPGFSRAWIVHLEQSDRLFFSSGDLMLVLYDAREQSPTFGVVTEHVLGVRDRALVHIPPGVVHGVKNIGLADGRYLNLPSRPYRHDDPDKYRLPADSPAVPYRI